MVYLVLLTDDLGWDPFLGVGVGLVVVDADLGKVLEVVLEWTSHCLPSIKVLEDGWGGAGADRLKLDIDRWSCLLLVFKLDIDRWWSLMEDWLLGFLGGLLGGEEGSIPSLVLGNLDKAALDKVAYKDFMESKKLDLGWVPDPVALYSDPADFEVSL